MLVINKSENVLREILCAYFINSGPSIKAITPDRTSSREIGFQLTRSIFNIDAPIGAIDKDQIINGRVYFAILKR